MAQIETSTILAELRGQSIVLPDLNGMFDGWPQDVNINLDQLRRDVNGWLDRYQICSFTMAGTSYVITVITFGCCSTMSHNPKLEAFKKADFAYLGATWWPHASYDRLKIATFLAGWVSISLRFINTGIMLNTATT